MLLLCASKSNASAASGGVRGEALPHKKIRQSENQAVFFVWCFVVGTRRTLAAKGSFNPPRRCHFSLVNNPLKQREIPITIEIKNI